jgi:hypothetical protein
VTGTTINNNQGTAASFLDYSSSVVYPFTFSGNTLSGNGGDAVDAFQLATLTFTNNTLTNNSTTAGSDTAQFSFADTTPDFSGTTITSTRLGAMVLNGALSSSFTLPTYGLVYSTTGLTIDSGATLTIPAGTVFKIQAYGPALTVNGTLIANGTTSSPIIFTSYYDDSVGGDTDGDGGSTSPSPGDWGSIQINTGGAATLSNALVSYGGGPCFSNSCYRANLVLNGGSLSLSNSTISNSNNDGVDGSGSLTVTGSTIVDNTSSGVNLRFASGSVNNSYVYSNKSYGVANANSALSIDASNNWWGSNDGPAPYGSGNGVNIPYVVVAPWTTNESSTPFPGQTPTSGPTPTPIATATPYPVPTTDSESYFRSDLSSTASSFPVMTPQSVGTIFDPGGQAELWGGLASALYTECDNERSNFQTGSQVLTVCAAQALAGTQYLTLGLLDATQSALNVGLDTFFSGFSEAGQAIIAQTQTLVDYSLNNCTLGPGLADDVLEQVALQVAQAEAANYVDDYLNSPNFFEWSLQTVISTLSPEGPTSSCAKGLEEAYIYTQPLTPVNVTIAYVYDPYSHLMTAHISSDHAGGTMYVVQYPVDSTGRESNSSPTILAFGGSSSGAGIMALAHRLGIVPLPSATQRLNRISMATPVRR